MTSKQLGSYFRNARISCNLTQKEVAESLNYSSQNISLWESGKIIPKLDSVFEFCNALKIDPTSFFKGEIKESKEESYFDNERFLSSLNHCIDSFSINKRQLEDWLDVSRPTLNKILKGEVIINLNQFLNLNEKLPLNDLYFEEQEKPSYSKKNHYLFYLLLITILSLALAGLGCLLYFVISSNIHG